VAVDGGEAALIFKVLADLLSLLKKNRSILRVFVLS